MSGESESGTATDCHFPEPGTGQQDALLVVERQMSYMRQQLSPVCSAVTRTTITSEGIHCEEVYVIAGGEWLRNNLNAIAAL